MRTIVSLLAVVVPGTVFAADEPAKKTEPPYALLEFSRDATLDQWTSTFVMTTSSGATYELAVDFGDRGNAYDLDALRRTLAVNWVTESADRCVKIYGVRTKDGKTDSVKTLVLTNKLRVGTGQMPVVTGTGGAKVEVRTDDGKNKPDAARKVPPKGPTLPGETFVEFDLSTLPPGADGVDWEMTWEVRTTAGKEEPWVRFTFVVASDDTVEGIPIVTNSVFPRAGFKTELIDKTKIRVYGGAYEGKYYPAEKGIITSPHLKPEQLPKITNPKRF